MICLSITSYRDRPIGRWRIGAENFSLTTATLLWGLLFGSIGVGFFIYGKKQRMAVPLVCGLALMFFPYLVSNPFWLVGIGITLVALPYFFRI